ncbi:MAG: hypothetical protein HY047_16815 [Acidobacteria bacterium]|nr:hypothetical protein [Acidobacteriota bacterium]
MAFLKFSRDKRGYERFALVQPTTNRRGATRPRLLYMFRTPPDAKVGREPFDEAIRRALETQYPDVSFDWRKILETPIPSADVERWRERRRAERAARQAAAVEVGVMDAEPPATTEAPPGSDRAEMPSSGDAAAGPAESPPADDRATRRRRRRRRGRRGRADALAGSLPASAESTSVAREVDAVSPPEALDAAGPTETPTESAGE